MVLITAMMVTQRKERAAFVGTVKNNVLYIITLSILGCRKPTNPPRLRKPKKLTTGVISKYDARLYYPLLE